MRPLGAIVVLLTCAALLAGCGAYTKRDFVARADAICATAVRDARSIPPPSFGQTAASRNRALAGYLTRVVPIAASEQRQLQALRRPATDARQRSLLVAYLNALAGITREYRELAYATASSDTAAVTQLETELGSSPASTLAASYGLRSCETPGATVS